MSIFTKAKKCLILLAAISGAFVGLVYFSNRVDNEMNDYMEQEVYSSSPKVRGRHDGHSSYQTGNEHTDNHFATKNDRTKSVSRSSPGMSSSSTSVSTSPRTSRAETTRKSTPKYSYYVLNPSHACANRTEVVVLVAVHVRRSGFKQRQVIRETWSKDYNKSVVLFFLGRGNAKEPADTEKKIRSEYSIYRDIVEADFVDSYRNLTMKSLSMINWCSIYCTKSQYLLKADADVYVHLPNLISSVEKISKKVGSRVPFISGYLMTNIKPVRKKGSKWTVPLSDYAKKAYPVYTIGASYTMTSSAAAMLYRASKKIPYFWIEDIYVTGMCADVAGVKRVQNPLQTPYMLKPSPGCSFKSNMASSHGFSVEKIRKTYRDIHNPNLNCTKSRK